MTVEEKLYKFLFFCWQILLQEPTLGVGVKISKILEGRLHFGVKSTILDNALLRMDQTVQITT